MYIHIHVKCIIIHVYRRYKFGNHTPLDYMYIYIYTCTSRVYMYMFPCYMHRGVVDMQCIHEEQSRKTCTIMLKKTPYFESTLHIHITNTFVGAPSAQWPE